MGRPLLTKEQFYSCAVCDKEKPLADIPDTHCGHADHMLITHTIDMVSVGSLKQKLDEMEARHNDWPSGWDDAIHTIRNWLNADS
jgi:hypothetical protein